MGTSGGSRSITICPGYGLKDGKQPSKMQPVAKLPLLHAFYTTQDRISRPAQDTAPFPTCPAVTWCWP
jgi:hypothetical protein